ncbi:MAG TPA: ATP-binding protein [Candidatus Eisenbacteria bacterium]
MSLNRNVQAYIGLIVALAGIALVSGSVQIRTFEWQTLALWSMVCVVAELLWLNTLTGQGTVSMASTFNLAIIFLLGWEKSLWVAGASTLFANLAIQKKEWYKALFNTAQSILSTAIAGILFLLTGGVTLLPDADSSGVQQIASFLSRFNDARLIIPFLACGLAYHFANTFFVSGVISLASKGRLLPTWRENYGYSEEIVSSLALIFLSPLVVLSFGAVSFLGIILFFVPLLFVRDASRRYLELMRTQDAMIKAAALAARGEMAAKMAHELNNYLAAISARAQMILMYQPIDGDPRTRKSGEIIYENITKMKRLVDDMVRPAATHMRRTVNLNSVVEQAVDLSRFHERFDDVSIDVVLDPAVPPGQFDDMQIQQVIMNLLKNAGEAMLGADIVGKRVEVRTAFDAERNQVILTVTDNGPGMPTEVAARIFKTSFTTKADGHGLGLSTSNKIIQGHDGRIVVESRPGAGATFTITLPLAA